MTPTTSGESVILDGLALSIEEARDLVRGLGSALHDAEQARLCRVWREQKAANDAAFLARYPDAREVTLTGCADPVVVAVTQAGYGVVRVDAVRARFGDRRPDLNEIPAWPVAVTVRAYAGRLVHTWTGGARFRCGQRVPTMLATTVAGTDCPRCAGRSA